MELSATHCIYPHHFSAPMETRLCYQVLELQPGISLIELRQAYKDLVQVWHPDRFSHNPRLQAKAQVKMTELNHAYDTLKPILEQRDRLNCSGHGYSGPEYSGFSAKASSPGPSTDGRTAQASPPSARSHPSWNQTRAWGQTRGMRRHRNRFSLRWYFTILGMSLLVMLCLLAPFLIAYVIAQQPGLFLLPVVALVSLCSYRYLGVRS